MLHLYSVIVANYKQASASLYRLNREGTRFAVTGIGWYNLHDTNFLGYLAAIATQSQLRRLNGITVIQNHGFGLCQFRFWSVKP